MNNRSFAWTVPFLALAILFHGNARAVDDLPADFVLLSGKVHTLDAANSVVEAIVIRKGKIDYVGSDAGARPHIGDETRVYRAAGRTVVPGINETHVHAIGVAQGEIVQPFRQLRSIAEIQAWTREAAAKTPEGEWIRLPRVDITRIAERRIPTRAELDAAAPHQGAVYIWAYANRQIQVLNSAALKAAGIHRDSRQPDKGRIFKDESGEPTGVIEDAPSLTAKFLPRKEVKREEMLESLTKVLRGYNKLGITSITERGSNVEGWKTYRELHTQGRLTARATVTIRVASDGTVAGTERFINALPLRPGEGDDWVKVGPLKIGVDGGVLYGTAWLREPYGEAAFGLYGLDDPQYRGLLQMDAEKVANVIRTGHRRGWQMSSHVTGDAGVDIVLDAVEAADADRPINSRRYTLIHAYFPTPDAAARAAKLGVVVDTQPMWHYKDGDALAEALGEQRMSRFIGVATWRAAGVKVALNSDHMQGVDPDLALNPFNPWLALYSAVTRSTESGAVLGAGERIDRLTALRMMTSDAAYIHFDEAKKGTLEVGKLGDLVVLSDDYFSCDESQIPKIRSLLTVVDGGVVYEAEVGDDTSTEKPQARVVESHGYAEAIVLTRGKARAVLCPEAGGRVLAFSVGDQQALWFDDQERNRQAGKAPPMSAGRFDFGPELVTPAHAVIWSGKWTAAITGDSSARLTSQRDELSGVQLTRDFELSDSGALVCKQTITNVSKQSREVCHWGRSFSPGGGICLVPLAGQSRFPSKYAMYEDSAIINVRNSDERIRERDGFLEILGPPRKPKLGFDSYAGWLAYLMPGDKLFVKRFQTFPNRVYNEAAGLTLSVWYPEGPRIELEPIGPREKLAPGDSASFTETWYLLSHPFPRTGQSIDLARLREQVTEQTKAD